MGSSNTKSSRLAPKRRSNSTILLAAPEVFRKSNTMNDQNIKDSIVIIGQQARYRKCSDQTSADIKRDAGSFKKSRISFNSRFSSSSQASTMNSDTHKKSISNSSPDSQISPQKIIEEDNLFRISEGSSSGSSSKINYHEMMLIRYHQDLKELPECDQEDFLLNPKGCSEQVAPEYAHEIFHLLQRQEEQQILKNYLCESQRKDRFMDKKGEIKEVDRDLAVKKIIDLCEQKSYKMETMLLAINIFDVVLSKTYALLSKDQLPLIITAVTIIAAKMEQPLTPSINRMIKLLDEEEQETVDKSGVIHMEEEILKVMQFDFNLISPLTFLERYFKISDYQDDKNILKIAHALLKLGSANCHFLNFKPSLTAAAILVLAVNFASHSLQQQKSKQYNINVWNQALTNTTGIKKEDFEEVLHLLNSQAEQSVHFQIKSLQKLFKNKLNQ